MLGHKNLAYGAKPQRPDNKYLEIKCEIFTYLKKKIWSLFPIDPIF